MRLAPVLAAAVAASFLVATRTGAARAADPSAVAVATFGHRRLWHRDRGTEPLPLLRTTEEMLGISTYLGHAADSSTGNFRRDFNLVP